MAGPSGQTGPSTNTSKPSTDLSSRGIEEAVDEHHHQPNQSCVGKHGVLDESQHGFRGERGTDSALLSIINELEKARIDHSTQLFCTYDCQRAFDSPSKNAQKLGWHTRGVPAEFAEFIVGLEEGGQTVVRNPTSADIHLRKGLESLTYPDGFGFPGTFEAERGSPQGDVSMTSS